MLNFYRERNKGREISGICGKSDRLALVCCHALLIGMLSAGLVLLPWSSDSDLHASSKASARAPVQKAVPREGAIQKSDPFWNVMAHLHSYKKVIRNWRYLTVIDFSKPSSSKRMYLVDMKTGRVEKYLLSHGKNSGWAYATSFSNRPGSFKSCNGFFITGKKYYGKHGAALQLHGLEKGINDNALKRGIVMHGSNYVSICSVKANGGRLGRSLGCPVVPAKEAESVINRIKGGSLVYIHTGTTYQALESSSGAVKRRN
jgi:hypothetical protein